jgi:hypothetical protein
LLKYKMMNFNKMLNVQRSKRFAYAKLLLRCTFCYAVSKNVNK